MKDKIEGFIIDLLRKNGKIIVPRLGVLLNSGKLNEKVIFNEFIKFNDGILVKQIAQKERMMQNEALQQLEAYVETIHAALDAGKSFEIDQVGKFSMDEKKKINFEGFGEIDTIRPKQNTDTKKKGLFGNDNSVPKKLTEAEIKRKEADDANKKMKEESLRLQAEIKAKAQAILAGQKIESKDKETSNKTVVPSKPEVTKPVAPENKLAQPAPVKKEEIKTEMPASKVEEQKQEVIKEVAAITETPAPKVEIPSAENHEKATAEAEALRLKSIADAAQKLKDAQDAEAKRLKAYEEKKLAEKKAEAEKAETKIATPEATVIENKTVGSALGNSLLRNPIKKEEPVAEKQPEITAAPVVASIPPVVEVKKENTQATPPAPAAAAKEKEVEKPLEAKAGVAEKTASAPIQASKPPKKKKRLGLVLFIVFAVLLAGAAVGYFLLNKPHNDGHDEHAASNATDSTLHENESAQASENGSDTSTVSENTGEENKSTESSFLDETDASEETTVAETKEEKPATKPDEKTVAPTVEKTKAETKPAVQPKATAAPQQTIIGQKYYVIVGSFQFKDFAENQRKKLVEEGFSSAVVVKERNNMFPVSFGVFENRSEAEKMRDEAKGKGYSDAWILKY